MNVLRKQEKTNKGITLIALVITIIVLLILAGISIATLTGENGILKKANTAKIETERATAKEKVQMAVMSSFDNNGKLDYTQLKTNLDKVEGIDKSTVPNPITELPITVKVDGYDVTIDIDGKITIAGEPSKPDEPLRPYTLEETMGGANSPNISEFNVENTYYVTWGTTAPYQTNETSTINNAPPSGWSNYNGKEWANIKTTGGGNDCYWVWIPRYAYCITEGYHTNTAKTIDIKFLKGTSNTPIDGSSIEIKNQTGSGNWNVHPAFWFDKNNNGIEDSGEQLTGIWVAKYEASSSIAEDLENLTNEKILEKIANDGGSETDTDLKVRVKPNVTSWRGITVNDIFTVCRNLTKTGNSLENTNNLDSHMMKNTEWGAVTYLSMSQYGKNGEVWNNPYYNNTTNDSPITGLCSNETDGKDKGMADITKTCKYNEMGGGNASTTGNVYGVYDMSGGAWEYVAGILSNNKKNGNNTEMNNYYDFSNSNTYPNRYFDWDAGTSNDRTENYNANTGKYGDAIHETSSSGNSKTDSWDSSYSVFLDSSYPVFVRGGRAYTDSNAGVFAFSHGTGEAGTYCGFRVVVVPF